MEVFDENIADRTEREISRLIGYRLLGWAIITLWAVTVFVLFRAVRQFPAGIDSWLLWVSPLVIFRGIAGVILHKQLKTTYLVPSLAEMRRMSMLFGVSDGLLILSAVIVFTMSAVVPVATLVVVAIAALAFLALVYMLTPLVTAVAAAVVVVPALAIAYVDGIAIPVELLLSGLLVLAGTYWGALGFRRLFMSNLQENISYQNQIREASESNFIFNQHWQNMQVAAIDWDRDFNIRSWNPAAERIFGVSAEDAIGRPPELLFAPEDARILRSQWSSEATGEGGGVLRSHLRDGDRFWAEWYDTPLVLGGEIIGIASFVVELRGRPQLVEGVDRPADWQPQPVPKLGAGDRQSQGSLGAH